MLRICTMNPLRCAALLLPMLLACCAAQETYVYEEFPTGCYMFHTEKVDWGTAWEICMNEGGHLGIINSDAEAVIFKGLCTRISQTYSNVCFVGFHDYFVEGHHVTISGDDLSKAGYNTWLVGEPNNAGAGEDCGSITHEALLSDVDCFVTSPFICEIDLVGGVTCPTAP